MSDPIINAWHTHGRLQHAFLQAIPEASLAAKLGGKGRSIGAIYAHIHHNRLAWLEPAAPDLLAGLAKMSKEQTADKTAVAQALAASEQAIAALLGRSLQAGGKVKGFGGHAAHFLGYMIAHDSYHQGEIGIILAQTGFKPDNQTAYGLWNWK